MKKILTLKTYRDVFLVDDELGSEEIKIYFRIPFTMYFVGREIGAKLVLFTKQWERNGYSWKKV